jgi:hypothetical protein
MSYNTDIGFKYISSNVEPEPKLRIMAPTQYKIQNTKYKIKNKK